MKKSKFIADFQDIPSPRQKMPELPIEERTRNFREVELGLTEEMAVAEARRCLSCRRCIGCGLCLAECDQRAIVYDQSPQVIDIKVDAVILAPGAEKFNPVKLRECGYSRFSNVITSIELERVLSPNGPFAGFVLRPGDGEIPKKVAFVQCIGSRNEEISANYCSNVCCMVTLKQALRLQEKIKGVQQRIFFSEMRPFARNGESYLIKAQQAQNIKFIKSTITEINAINESGNVSLKYNNNGAIKNEEFELVVLAIGLHRPSTGRSLSKSTGIQLNAYGFCATDLFAPVGTSEEGVCVAGAFSGPKDIITSVMEADAAVHATLSQLAPAPAIRAHYEAPEKQQGGGGPVGVYLCEYGLNLVSGIDPDELKKSMTAEKSMAYVGSTRYCCSRQGISAMRTAISDHNLNKLFIAPCYPATHTKLFAQLFDGSVPSMQIIDIKKMSTLKDAAGMSSIIKTAVTGQGMTDDQVLAPIGSAVVLGAGFSGMNAALNVAKRGFKVHLVEKSSTLGGAFSPGFAGAFSDDAEKKFNNLVASVQKHEHITVHLNSKLIKLEGPPGEFISTIQNDNGGMQITHGALLVATGADENIPKEYGYSKDTHVITQAELEEMLRVNENFAHTDVVMIQCVGSRNEEHPYCSSNCCLRAILNSLKIKSMKQECQIHVLHRDIRLHDFQESYYTQAVESGIRFARITDPPHIEHGRVKVAREGSEGDVSLPADLIVLSNGIIPSQENRQLAALLNVKLDSNGFFCISESLLNSVQTEKAGIYVCGLASAPMTPVACATQAVAAAAAVCSFLTQ